MSLRIVRVIPFFAPATRFGGVVTQAAKVCAMLARRGHDVRVVTTDNGVPAEIVQPGWIERDGYRVHYAPTRPWHRCVPYWSPTMAPALREALAAADICTLNVGLTLANRLAARLAGELGTSYVYNAEGALCPTRLALKGARKRMFLRLVERPLLADAAACQAVTAKEVNDLVHQGVAVHRIRQIPNGIEPFTPGDGRRFRAAHGIAADALLVLYLGRLHQVKGVDRLLDSFARAAPPEAVLVFAGGDDDGTGARAATAARHTKISERVRFTGHLEADGRRDALSAADIFALTSHSEGLPNAILEALAAGVPCLLTTACNVPEVATAGAGEVVTGDEKSLDAALRRLLAEPERRRTMAARARQLATETFSLDRVVDELEQLYIEIAGQR